MDCPKRKCGLKTSDLFLMWAVTLQVHQRVYEQFHTTVHFGWFTWVQAVVSCDTADNQQQTCFATDNQPALRDVSSQYDWELGRHNSIYIDVFSCNCYMLFLCHCKDAICDNYNKVPSLHSLRLSNPNLIISQQCCGLLLLSNGIDTYLICFFQGSLFLLLEYQLHLIKSQNSKRHNYIVLNVKQYSACVRHWWILKGAPSG